MHINFTLTNITTAATFFLNHVKDKKVIALHGHMGAGKTTLVHAICKNMGVSDAVSSPTFSIINEYSDAKGNIIYHLDLYRIKNEQEAIDAGVEDCFYSNHLCFVEWPDKTPNLLPTDVLHCYLTVVNDVERKLVMDV